MTRKFAGSLGLISAMMLVGAISLGSGRMAIERAPIVAGVAESAPGQEPVPPSTEVPTFEFVVPDPNGEIVERYGTIRRYSTSGSLAFRYDEARHPVGQGDDAPRWFWATVPAKDEDELDRRLGEIADAPDGQVYRITGVRGPDDCEYAPGVCFENIESVSLEPYFGK